MQLRNKRWLSLLVALGLLQGISRFAWADSYEARVVRVTDGDTIVVLDDKQTQHRIRLAAIDAPERKQAFGQVSRQHLAQLVLKKRVTVVWTNVDRYQRQIGKIIVDGQDANLAQVQAGLAWHYKRYAKEQPEEKRTAYADAETDARRNDLGLWRDATPVPPWEFRRSAKQRR
ncbi:thermonuclease family protein [Nitrogeniibacter mangrovi]|uniref:Thermonuclease family protein n=1 Tax=Nitrogeniibacter mangrovi TaxID=2016596 RepID=A0A6C1B964_9RHOO|nr:thermonuclease family protein [Nitrogeniibacter mangrovi]QID19375.1 thermonuclease family protein [Nitrogeniibacter mangrovi]